MISVLGNSILANRSNLRSSSQQMMAQLHM